MNPHIPTFVAGLIGFGLGLASGYIFVDAYLRDRYNNEIEEELYSTKQDFAHKYKEQTKDIPERPTQTTVPTVETVTPNGNVRTIKDYNQPIIVEEPPSEEEADVYDEIISAYTSTLMDISRKGATRREREENKEKGEKVVYEIDMMDPSANLCEINEVDERQPEPYFIDYFIFETNDFHHDQITLTYFPIDQVLLDDQDNVLDFDQMGLSDVLNRIPLPIKGEEYTEDNDPVERTLVYIRHNQDQKDYELILDWMSFEDYLGGGGYIGESVY